jgi:hypothetical protein
MTAEDMSGHMNYEFTAPSKPARYKTPGPGRLREADADSHMKAPVVIQDVSADEHGSHVPAPNHVGGFHFKVREV